jgi:hypothetical protein
MAAQNTNLEQLIKGIEEAVVHAAYAVQLSNLTILQSYFVKVKDEEGEPIEKQRRGVLLSDDPPRNIFELPEFGGTYAPKTIAIQYPLMNPAAQKAATREEDGKPVPEDRLVHTVYVPLISLAPPATYYVDEVTVKLNAEIQLDESGQEILVFVPAPDRKASGSPDGLEADAFVKVVVKRGDDSATKTEVIRGYDRATRAEIPG